MRNPFNEGKPEEQVWQELNKNAKPLPLGDNAPDWLLDSAFNKSEIARRIGISAPSFKNKIDGRNGNRLTEANLTALDEERLRLLKLLS